MGLFSKAKKNEKTDKLKTADRIIFEQLVNDDDKHITDLIDKMIDGNPVLLNFEKIHVDSANKIISFFAGVIYAIDGKVVTIKDDTYLFANDEAYDDGSLEIFVKNL